MKKTLGAVVGLALAVLTSPVFAASLSNGALQTCSGTGTWHFVNNQTGGATTGLLDVTFSSGTQTGITPSKVEKSTIHFYVIASGTLQAASTNIPGKLVLSDFTCDTKCDPKPEVCDNKVDDDCDGAVDADDSDCKK